MSDLESIVGIVLAGGRAQEFGCSRTTVKRYVADRVPWRGVAGGGQHELRSGPGRSVRHGRQADDRIIGDGGDGLKGHVAGALYGPFVVLLEQDRADETGDGGLVREEMPTTSVRRLISPLTRWSGLVECSFARCCWGKVM